MKLDCFIESECDFLLYVILVKYTNYFRLSRDYNNPSLSNNVLFQASLWLFRVRLIRTFDLGFGFRIRTVENLAVETLAVSLSFIKI